MPSRGYFITIEGIEGVGKSSQVPVMRALLEQAGIGVEVTREPGGTAVADRIRAMILAPGQELPGSDAELLLIFAARAEHLAKRIEPALTAGRWVVCDRFTDATYAYQGGGQGIPAERIAAVESWVQRGLEPDRTLLLDAPVELALERARGRGGTDRFEAESVAFFERARAAYLARARAATDRFRVIDASGSPSQVEQSVRDSLADLVPGSSGASEHGHGA